MGVSLGTPDKVLMLNEQVQSPWPKKGMVTRTSGMSMWVVLPGGPPRLAEILAEVKTV